jgi:hypothetical protein
MTRRLTRLRVLFAVVLLINLAAFGTHEASTHRQPCVWAMGRVSRCAVLR